jgi:hypothetical protein
MQRNSFKRKPFTLPSGKIINLQGYEPFCVMGLLNEGLTENDLVTEITAVPKIIYIKPNGNVGFYFVDIYLPLLNSVIEVKSLYTLKKEIEKNLLKFQATIDHGYKFYLSVYDENGNEKVWWISLRNENLEATEFNCDQLWHGCDIVSSKSLTFTPVSLKSILEQKLK